MGGFMLYAFQGGGRPYKSDADVSRPLPVTYDV